jgi:hypothetical protein
MIRPPSGKDDPMLAPAKTKFATLLAMIAVAAMLAGAPAAAFAADGEGRGGGASRGHAPAATASRNAGKAHQRGSAGAAEDADFVEAGPPNVVYGDFGPAGLAPGRHSYPDPTHADHRWILGPLFDEARDDLPSGLPFARHLYGDHDFQYCMRRDVYGDLYQAC